MGSGNLAPLQRFFLHYPEGHRLYVCIVDQQRRAFDFSDNTFKVSTKLASIIDACLFATGRREDRADHGYSYSLEIDLARLLAGADPETVVPREDSAVTVHWLRQAGDEPDVSVDLRLGNTCLLRNVGGRFEIANPHDRERQDENRAFENREKAAKEYSEFILREIDSQKPRYERLEAAVRTGNVAATLHVLAEDLCFWAGNLKPHLLHHLSHFAKDPFFVRSREVPPNAAFQVYEHWAIRDLLGSREAFDLLEFHKSPEYARSFSARLDRLHEKRVEFSQLVTQYIIQHRGEDVEGLIGLDEMRKEIKHQALCLAEHIDLIAAQFEAIFAPNAEKGRSMAERFLDCRNLTAYFYKWWQTTLGEAQDASDSKQRETATREANGFKRAYFTARKWLYEHTDVPETNIHALIENKHGGSSILIAPARRALVALDEQGDNSKLLAFMWEHYPAQCEAIELPRPAKTNATAPTDAQGAADLEAVGQVKRPVGVSDFIEAAQPAEDHSSIDAQVANLVPTAETESKQFSGGEIVFYRDRVEICGVDVCSGRKSKSKRVLLEMLSKRRDNGEFIAYGGDELENTAQHLGVTRKSSGWIRDVRDDIMERLRTQANIISGHKDVILSGDRGYRFAECLSVRYADPPTVTDITDTDDVHDVREDDVHDVFDVRDDEAKQRRTWIVQQLSAGVRLRIQDVADQFNRSKKTAQRDFDALREQGKVEFVGDAKTGYYRLCGTKASG